MVTAFLNFARPQPLQLEQVSLAELIDDCAAELAPVFQELNVQLIVDAEKAQAVQADERMLRLALLNLMRNAAEANPGGRVYVRTALESIEVRDTGAGIPVNEMQKIFIPFFTTKAKGHGIGLALSHRIVSQHGGTLTAANSSEGGAVFTINLATDKRRLVTD